MIANANSKSRKGMSGMAKPLTIMLAALVVLSFGIIAFATSTGTSGANIPFFMTSEHLIGNKISDLNEFDEYPVSLNDYAQTTEKCGDWKCTAWDVTTTAGIGKYCSGIWNCTQRNGNSCAAYNCTAWSNSATARRDLYCSSGWNCTGWDNNSCNSWSCATRTPTTVNDVSKICSGIWNCTSFNGSLCGFWNCTAWSNAATVGTDQFCSGGWNCIDGSTGSECKGWNCTAWSSGTASDGFDRYCSGVLNCTQWNGDVCSSWNCTARSLAVTTLKDVYCADFNCTNWNQATKSCGTWNCTNWTEGPTAQMDYYCSGVYNCTSWQTFTYDTTPPAAITNLQNISSGVDWIYWNWTNPSDSDFNSTIIYLNGVNVVNLTSPANSYNATGLDSDTNYTITINTKDTNGNINTTNVTSSARTASVFSSFGRCVNITIKNAGATTLTNFPAYINLTYDSDMLSDYSDLRFYNASCNNAGTLLNYSIENYTAANAYTWVNIPSLATGNTTISVYYKNNTAVSSGENKQGVWDSNYKMVLHLKETSGTLYDSTSNGNNGTSINGSAYTANGRVDGAYGFDGVNDEIDTLNTSSLAITGNLTVEAWAKPNNTGVYMGIAGKITDSAPNYLGYALTKLTTNAFRFQVANSDAGTLINSSSTYADTNWHYVVGVINGTNGYLFVDGVQQGTAAVTLGDNGKNFTIGRHYINGPTPRYFNGTIDEVRVSNTGRSADWINESYQMVANQSSFVTFGAEQLSVVSTLISPTNGQAINNSVNFTCNATDAVGLANITFYWNYSGSFVANGTVTLTGTANQTIFQRPNLASRSILWNCYACNNRSDCAFASSNWTVTVNDTIAPSINIVYPANTTYNTKTDLPLNYTATDNNAVSACWYSVDSGSNVSISGCTNTTFNVSSDGSHNVRVYANDTSNNTNSSIQYFTVDTTPPAGVTNLGESSTNQTWIYWNWTNPADADFNHTEVWLNGTFKANVSAPANYYNATGLNSSTTYQIQTRTADHTGNVNATWVNDTATTLTSCTENWTVNYGSCLTNDTKLKYYTDANSCGTYGSLPGDNGTYVACNYCSYSVVTTNWTGWQNSGSCLINDSQLQNRSRIEYDANYSTCYAVTNLSSDLWNNITDWDYNYTGCNYGAPYWTSVNTSPASPAPYSPVQSYQFNTTWADNAAISSVLFEHNFTGSVSNYSQSGNSSDVYFYNYGALAAGTYYWKSWAKDNLDNWNSTPVQEYIVNKAAPVINLTLNGADSDISAPINTIVNISVALATPPGIGVVELLENGVFITSTSTSTVVQTNYTTTGTKNWTARYNATQNYSSSSKTHLLSIVDPNGPQYTDIVASPSSPTQFSPTQNYQFNVTWTDITGISNAILEFAGVNYSWQTGQLNKSGDVYSRNFGPMAAVTYSYKWYANDTDNNNASTPTETYTIEKAVTALFLTFSPSNTVTYNTSTSVGCSANNPESSPSLTRNGTGVSNPDAQTLAAGTYSYACIASTTQNYTSASQTGTLYVNKATTVLNMTILPSTSIVYGINSTASCSANNGEVSSQLFRNGASAGNPDAQVLTAGNHTYTCNATASQNWTSANAATQVLSVAKASNPVNLSINGFADQNVTEYLGNETAISSTVTATAFAGAVHLLLDSVDVGSPYAANMSIGNYEFLASTTGDENYTANSTSFWLSVKPNVIETIFNGTDFSNISNYSSIPNVTLEITNKGKIAFSEAIVINRSINVDANVNISSNYIFVNSTALPEFNKSATLQLYNLSFTNPKIMRDGVECSNCTKLSYTGGTLAFTVPSFSAYWAAESAVAPYCGDGTCNNGETCSSCSTDCGTCPSSPPSSGSSGNWSRAPTCTENWYCSDWTVCSNSIQNRACSDRNKCGTTKNIPLTNQSCVSCQENWVCNEWSECTNSLQTRYCIDQNECSSTNDKPREIQSCEEKPNENEIAIPQLVEVQRAPNPELIALTIAMLFGLVGVLGLRSSKISNTMKQVLTLAHVVLVLSIVGLLVITFAEQPAIALISALAQIAAGNWVIIVTLIGIVGIIGAELVLRGFKVPKFRLPKFRLPKKKLAKQHKLEHIDESEKLNQHNKRLELSERMHTFEHALDTRLSHYGNVLESFRHTTKHILKEHKKLKRENDELKHVQRYIANKEKSITAFARSIRLPKISVPKFAMPKIKIHVPKLALPKLSLHGERVFADTREALLHAVQKFAMPKLAIPKLRVPKISVPKLTLPKLSIPKISVPKFVMYGERMFASTRKALLHAVPKLNIPKLSLPRLVMPKLAFPRLSIPRINVPKISMHSKRMFASTRKALLHAVPKIPKISAPVHKIERKPEMILPQSLIQHVETENDVSQNISQILDLNPEEVKTTKQRTAIDKRHRAAIEHMRTQFGLPVHIASHRHRHAHVLGRRQL